MGLPLEALVDALEEPILTFAKVGTIVPCLKKPIRASPGGTGVRGPTENTSTV